MAKRIISYLSFTIIFTLLLYNHQWADSIASADDTDSSKYSVVFECEDIKYAGAKRVEVHYDGHELKLIGITDNNRQFVIARTKPKKDEQYGKVDDYDCKGNTISITEKWPFTNFYTNRVYQWNGKKLQQIKITTHDPSSAAIDDALNEALTGNLQEAVSILANSLYPSHYLGCGTIEDFLKKGHKASLSIQKTKGFELAATALENTFELMVAANHYGNDPLSNFDPKKSGPIPNRWLETFKHCEIQTSKYIPALNDYGFFLQESGQNSKAVDILLLVVSKDPKRTVAYLNLADAYWSLGKRHEAIDNYRQYEKLMIDSKKADKVPGKVKGRLKSNP